MLYVLAETLLYIPTLIFASDLFTRPRSYKRSMLLLFFNYIEIVVAFGVLYTLGNNMNKPFAHWFDSIYFSLVTSNSIGFGDYYPITTYGKVLVSMQAIFFLSFVILFLNFFSTKVKGKGYFDNDEIA
jgi:ABC-type Na+ efflux pump permease subunit